jgi:hypothetical protein
MCLRLCSDHGITYGPCTLWLQAHSPVYVSHVPSRTIIGEAWIGGKEQPLQQLATVRRAYTYVRSLVSGV